ncbi:MAG TPA: response regulator [Roseiflexaceae bacterium]|nr:response regulator [Roseiflexaceae bacterium]
MDNHTILVADSDLTVAACMAEALASQGYTVHCHNSGHLTTDAVAQLRPDVVIIDEWRFQADIPPLLEQLRRCDRTRSVAVIISSTDWQVLDALAEPLHAHGCATLLKPFELDQLFTQVAGALGEGLQLAASGMEQRYA